MGYAVPDTNSVIMSSQSSDQQKIHDMQIS